MSETTNQQLARLGLTAFPAGFGKRDIVNEHGKTLFRGNALEIGNWLRETYEKKEAK